MDTFGHVLRHIRHISVLDTCWAPYFFHFFSFMKYLSFIAVWKYGLVIFLLASWCCKRLGLMSSWNDTLLSPFNFVKYLLHNFFGWNANCNKALSYILICMGLGVKFMLMSFRFILCCSTSDINLWSFHVKFKPCLTISICGVLGSKSQIEDY